VRARARAGAHRSFYDAFDETRRYRSRWLISPRAIPNMLVRAYPHYAGCLRGIIAAVVAHSRHSRSEGWSSICFPEAPFEENVSRYRGDRASNDEVSNFQIGSRRSDRSRYICLSVCRRRAASASRCYYYPRIEPNSDFGCLKDELSDLTEEGLI